MRIRQRVFIEEYLKSWNATEAAIKAGYSPKTATKIASENLTKPDIRNAIEKRLTEMQMGADEVLKLLSDQARASLKPFLKIVGDDTFIDLSSEEAQQHLDIIKKIRTRRTLRKNGNNPDIEENWVEIELLDVTEARTLLGKHHKLFTDQLKVDMPLSVEGLQRILDKVYGPKEPDNDDDGFTSR